MDSLSPSQPVGGTGVQQPQVPPLSTADDNPDISASSIWRSDEWGPTVWLPPNFAAGENGIYTGPQVPLLHYPAEIPAEPEGGTALLERHPTPIPYNLSQGEGIRDTPPSDVPPTDNGVSSDSKTTKAEGLPRVLPKPPRPGFCGKCPDLSSFPSRNALRKHKRLVHGPPVPQCPMCPARTFKEPLARHLEKVHGITDSTAADSSLAIPASIQTIGTIGLSHTSDDAGNPSSNVTISGRVYCQEHDCGRGFSSKAHLESHVKFFHSKRTVEGQDSSSTGVVQGSVGQLPEHYVPTSTVAPPHEGGRVTQDDPSVGTRVPNLSAGGHPDINSQAGNAGKPLPSTQGGVNTQLKSPATNILSLHCRMCDAPPMATTQPTVTTCGHLFCSECITGHVVSTSRCPVCNSSILLYCLFKLDLLAGS